MIRENGLEMKLVPCHGDNIEDDEYDSEWCCFVVVVVGCCCGVNANTWRLFATKVNRTSTPRIVGGIMFSTGQCIDELFLVFFMETNENNSL
jgi:hypothetical protein